MSDKHTPGPWGFSSDLRKGGIARVVPSYRQRFCIATIPVGNDVDAKEADARLIAAAPTMLHALRVARQSVMEMVEGYRLALAFEKECGHEDSLTSLQEELATINEAITLATGEQP